jgi:putative transposase
VLRKRIREIAEARPSYGYTRIHVLLRREGWPVNRKRVHRLYRLEGLQMRQKRARRRVMVAGRDHRTSADGPSQIWAMDWMHDELFDGRRLWVLTVVDTWSRFCPVLRVCRQAKALDVVEALKGAVARYGHPSVIRVDQGCQFTSREVDRGKPTDNAHAEAFNARLRAECLQPNWFLSLEDARAKVEAWWSAP